MPLSPQSVLKAIPAAIPAKDQLFLNGLRHTAEIAELSYRRLQIGLTEMAKGSDHPGPTLVTDVFLHAWAFVDAIDRFRMFWNLMPNSTKTPPTSDQASIDVEFAVIRHLRNVAVHLAQRADYVLAKSGTALGILRWFTVIDAANEQCMGCVLVPGAAQTRQMTIPIPGIGEEVEVPTGYILLSAGEHEENLSDVFRLLQRRVKNMEDAVEVACDKFDIDRTSNGADILLRAEVGPNQSRKA